jgi:cytochrome c peroxidase
MPAHATPLGHGADRRAWQQIDPADQEIVAHAFVNLAKALAAYQSRLAPGPSRFDRYVERIGGGQPSRGESPSGSPQPYMSSEELAGLRLFLSDTARCTRCHNGPLLTNHGFHNIGLGPTPGSRADLGRLPAIRDAPPEACTELRFTKRHGDELPGAFKVPTLRNVSETAPYMHDGRFATSAKCSSTTRTPPPTPSGTPR